MRLQPLGLAAIGAALLAVAAAPAVAADPPEPYDLQLDQYPETKGCGEFEVEGRLTLNGTGDPAASVYIDVWGDRYPQWTRNGTVTDSTGRFEVHGQLRSAGGPETLHVLASDPNPPFDRQEFLFRIEAPYDGCGGPGFGSLASVAGILVACAAGRAAARRRPPDQ